MSKHFPKISLVCPRCSIHFLRLAYYVRIKTSRNRNGSIYCSRTCYYRDRFGEKIRTISVVCNFCKNKIQKKKCLARLKERPFSFCDKVCYGKWRKLNLSGQNSPLWKGGKNVYLLGGWKTQRKKALKRDGNTCRDCGIKNQKHGYNLDVHHKIEYSSFNNPKEAHKLWNLISLCRKCHRNRHKVPNSGSFVVKE